MKQFLLFALGLLIFFPFISSCIIAVVDYAEPTAISPSEEFHRVVPFDSGGTISLENINGDIEIHGWDRNEVEVFAEKKISRPYGRKIRFHRIGRLLPEVDFDRFEDFIKIKTRPSRRDKASSTVDYYLSAPHSVNLKDVATERGNVSISDLYGEAFIDLAAGEVKIENFSGSLNASVINGSIQAGLYDLRSEDEIRLTAKQGDIIIYLQPEVNAQIEASSPNGNIFCEFDLGQTPSANKASGEIGEDGAIISLSSLNGDIHIKKF